MKKALSLLLICMSVCISYSCKKGLDGIDGKDGINGKDGTNGANGKDGSNGKDGKDGKDGKNAGVISRTFYTNWIYDSARTRYYYQMNIPELTSSFLTSGAVLVYAQSPAQIDDNSWSQLPLTIYRSSNFSTTLEVAFNIQSVRIWWQDSDLLTPLAPYNVTLRVVLISANALAHRPETDFDNYEMVKKVFDLR